MQIGSQDLGSVDAADMVSPERPLYGNESEATEFRFGSAAAGRRIQSGVYQSSEIIRRHCSR